MAGKALRRFSFPLLFAFLLTLVAGLPAGATNSMVTICHWANGHPHSITISTSALEHHFDHTADGWVPAPGHEQDSFGECEGDPESSPNPGGTVTVEKRVDGQPAAGWTFNATDQEPATTGADGTVQFSWDSAQPVEVTLTESPQAGFVLAAAACSRDDQAVGTFADGAMQLSVGPEDIIQCRFDNESLTAGIDIAKSGPAQAREGDQVTYRFTVTNTGDAALSTIVVTDDVLGAIGTIPSLAAGASQTLEKSWTIPAGQVGDVVNTATACGRYPVGETQQSMCDEADHRLDVVHPILDIDKSGPAQAHEGDQVTYRFTVTNTGDADLSNIVVTDDVLGAIGTIPSLAAGASQTLEKSWTIPAGQVPDVVNTAKACGDFLVDGSQQSACDEAGHRLDVLHPAIAIDKTANPLTINGSGDVTFTYVVRNTGDVALSEIAVDDDILGAITLMGALSLEPGQSVTVAKTAAVGLSSPTRNVGTARGQDPLGQQVSASDDAVITITPQVLGVVEVRAAVAELPRTGTDPRNLLLTGAALLAAGLMALTWRTRLRHA